MYQVNEYLIHFERCGGISAELFEAIITMCKLKDGKSYLSKGEQCSAFGTLSRHMIPPRRHGACEWS